MFIMNKCKMCQVEIVDDSMICPLCKNVLEIDREMEQVPRMYPEVTQHTRILKLIGRIYILAAVLCESVLVLLNYFLYRGVRWSLICGVVFLYLFITLKYSIDNPKAGLKMKIWVQTVGFALVMVFFDNITGYRGWSVNFAIPCIIIVMDAAIALLMIVHLDSWQNYLLLQIFMALSGITMIVLYAAGIVKHPVLSFVAAGISVVMLGLMLVFGGRKAKNELKRKFYV